jgi:hypothetical protein
MSYRLIFQDLFESAIYKRPGFECEVEQQGLGIRDEVPGMQRGLREVAVHGTRGVRTGEPVPGA